MLTPTDIFEKEFKRSLRGYNEDEVNEFLDQIIQDYSRLLEENKNLRSENSRLKSGTGTLSRSSASVSTHSDAEEDILKDLISRVEALEKKVKYF